MYIGFEKDKSTHINMYNCVNLIYKFVTVAMCKFTLILFILHSVFYYLFTYFKDEGKE